MSQKVTVVILAAGLGTRMKSNKAKVLHEAGGDTLLNHIIRAALTVAPAEQIVAVIGHQADQVRASVKFAGVRFAEQHEQKGTGHAVLCARQAVGVESGQLLILNGDGPLLKPVTLMALLGRQTSGAWSTQTSNGQASAEALPGDYLGYRGRKDDLGGSIVTTEVADPTGYGRIIRNEDGTVGAIVEEKVTNPEQRKIREINPGVYCFDATLFWSYIGEIGSDNPANEYYLTDMIEIMTRHGHAIAPLLVADETELLGINTRVELAIADKVLRARKTRELMLAGVTIENPETVTIDVDVAVAPDTIVEANVQLRGTTQIGANCRIGTGSVLRDCEIADGCTVLPYVVAESSSIGANASVGPFSRLRLQAKAAEGSHIGNFVELKKTTLGKGSKAGHLAYLGDSQIGAGVNIGAGTITCNYDGARKHPTTIADGAFVGSNSTLVAPVQIGAGSYIAAGSVITEQVEQDELSLGRARQVHKPEWAAKRRQATTPSPDDKH